MGKVPVIKAVVDTNVVISGLLFSGLPGKVISLWKKEILLPYASKEIIIEYLRVLAYPKFSLSRQEIDYLFYHEIFPFFLRWLNPTLTTRLFRKTLQTISSFIVLCPLQFPLSYQEIRIFSGLKVSSQCLF